MRIYISSQISFSDINSSGKEGTLNDRITSISTIIKAVLVAQWLLIDWIVKSQQLGALTFPTNMKTSVITHYVYVRLICLCWWICKVMISVSTYSHWSHLKIIPSWVLLYILGINIHIYQLHFGNNNNVKTRWGCFNDPTHVKHINFVLHLFQFQFLLKVWKRPPILIWNMPFI